MSQMLRKDADRIISASLKAVLPDEAVQRALRAYQPRGGRTLLVAAGKAAWQMAAAAVNTLGHVDGGVVVTKYGHVRGEIPGVVCCEGGHPVPDEGSFAGTLDGRKVAGTEVTLHYPYKNAQGRQDFSFLNGTLLWCEAPAQGDWLLLHKGLLHELAQSAFLVQNGYTAVPLEGTGLDQTFECYSHDGDSALPEYLAHRLEKLAAEAKTLGAVRLCREGTMFYLRDRFYTVTTKVRDLPEEKTLTSNLLPERDEVFSFFRWQQKAKPETEQ